MARIAHDPEEIIAVVDEKDNIIGQAPRDEVHEKNLLHREAGVWLVTPDRRFLLQKRADNNLWASSAAGHFPAEESYVQGVLREAKEELGIILEEQQLAKVFHGIIGPSHHRRFIKIFVTIQDNPIDIFRPDPEEVSEVKYFTIEEMDELIKKDLANNSVKAARDLIIPFLDKNRKL